jgi:DNA mismatch repair ATPase MutS
MLTAVLATIDVKPRVSEDGSLVIKGGRHPLVEKAMKDQAFVSNSTVSLAPGVVLLDRVIHEMCSSSSTHQARSTVRAMSQNNSSKRNTSDFRSVITGPNCAGKSTYMKALALITILAHMGSYVPAEDAFIPLRDRLLTRFGTSDDMEENASTFKVEMAETSFILETCSPRSLVLIDELGRGTSSDEGFAIAWSISEELISRRAYCCFATHYHDSNALAKLYPNARCYHMSAVPGTVSSTTDLC